MKPAIPAYVICPYTHPDPQVMEKRGLLAERLTAYAMEALDAEGITIAPFSPVAQYPRIGQYLPAELGKDHAYWMNLCKAQFFLHRLFILLPLDGWEISSGVGQELYWMTKIGGAELYVLRNTPADVDEFELGQIHTRRFEGLPWRYL